MTRLLAAGALVLLALCADRRELRAQLPASPDREVFTRQQLQAAGMQRLSELMPWLGTTAGTVESLAWIASVDDLAPSGLFAGGMAGPAIFVDGQPVSINTHQALFPELLPVSLPQIDSIVVNRSPALTGGTISERGSIHFHTSPVPPGISANAWGRHGAETGDPGPYRYTPLATPNIDRSGPDRVGVLGLGAGSWDLEISGRAMKTGVTDSLITANFGDLTHVFAYPRNAALKVGAEAGGGRHQLILARSWHLSNIYLPTHREVAHSTISQAFGGIGGGVRIGSASLSYRVTHSAMSADVPSRAAVFDRSRTHASAEASVPRGAWSFVGGVGLERVELEPETSEVPAESAARRLYPSLLTSVTHVSTRRTAQLVAGLRAAGGGVAERLLGNARWEVAPGRFVLASASYAPPGADEEDGLARSLSGEEGSASRYRIYRTSLGLSQRIFGLSASAAVTAAGVNARGDESTGGGGSFLGFSSQIATASASRVQSRLLYRATLPLGDGSAVETMARHHLRGFLSYEANPSLRFGAATLWKSAASWPLEEYAPGGGTAIEPINRLDLSIEKWFWKKRLRTQLMIGNALMRPERHHPSGANFSFRYFVGAGLELPVRE